MTLRVFFYLGVLVFSTVFDSVSAQSNVTDQGELSDSPALVVLISVDQMRRDRLDESLPGGLGRLLREGRVYTEANLDHGMTNTCPGHAVILTGMNPGRAGIVGNQTIHRETWSKEYCVDDKSADALVLGESYGRSPRNIKVTNLGDWMKARHAGTKIFSVAAKDRSAIALAGHNPDGAYWLNLDKGVFTTSHYYAQELPGWLRAFNGSNPLKDGFLAGLPTAWEHAVDGLRPDDYYPENEVYLNVSGHPLREGDLKEVTRQFYSSPFADSTVLTLARRIIEVKKLGQRGVTDLLAVSLASVDTVGHLYGPFSSESADTLVNLDKRLGELLGYLDRTIGEGRVLLALTSDHGVLELPEWKKEQGKSSCPYKEGRVGTTSLVAGLMSRIYLNYMVTAAPFTDPRELVKFAGSQIYINRRFAKEKEIDSEEVLAYVEKYFEELPYIAEVWNREELYTSVSSDQEMARLFRNSHDLEKGGDLLIQIHKDCLIKGEYGTTHMSPYGYDRDIPLIFWGWGVTPGKISGEAHSIDIAPTLAKMLGVSVIRPESSTAGPESSTSKQESSTSKQEFSTSKQESSTSKQESSTAERLDGKALLLTASPDLDKKIPGKTEPSRPMSDSQ